MQRISTLLLGAGLIALAACGGGGETATENVDTANVQADDLTLPPDETTDAGLGNDLGNESDLLSTNSTDSSAVDANAAAPEANSADANLTNSQ